MSATTKTTFFWTDWLGDQAVRRLTLDERGLWIDLLAIAATASPLGYVSDQGRPLTHEEIARLVGSDPVIVDKLIAGILAKGVASRDRAGRLYNRRMVREAEVRAKRKLAGSLGGAANQREINEQKNLLKHLLKQNRTWSAPLSKKERTFSFLSAGSLASAPYDSALTRPPSTERVERKQVANGSAGKPPSEATRAELEASFAKRANGHPVT